MVRYTWCFRERSFLFVGITWRLTRSIINRIGPFGGNEFIVEICYSLQFTLSVTTGCLRVRWKLGSLFDGASAVFCFAIWWRFGRTLFHVVGSHVTVFCPCEFCTLYRLGYYYLNLSYLQYDPISVVLFRCDGFRTVPRVHFCISFQYYCTMSCALLNMPFSVSDSVVNFPFGSIASVTSMCTIERFIYILLYWTFCSSISVRIVIIGSGANVERLLRQCFYIR